MKALFFENKLHKVVALKVASTFNKYAALGKASPLKYEDIKEPEIPNDNWLKVKNIACGLCGTDIHFMFMDMDPKCYPAAVPGISKKFLGHELVGEVVETGKNVDNVNIGDKIAMRIDWPSCNQLEIDPPCKQCAAGNYMLCENLGTKELPIVDQGGGFSPYMVMHKSQPFRIPETLDLKSSLLIEPVASAVHGVMKALPEKGKKALVIGAGTIGLLSVAALKHLAPEADIYCLVRHDFQAKIAESLGATVIREVGNTYKKVADITNAKYVKGYFGNKILLGGFDIVYDSIGNDNTLNNSLRFVRAGGDVVLIGINFKPGKIDYSTIWSKEIKLTGINCHANETKDENSFDIAAQILSANKSLADLIITHEYDMADYKEAVKKFLSKGESKAIKIVLNHK